MPRTLVSLPFRRLPRRLPRFETEAQGNSEMAYWPMKFPLWDVPLENHGNCIHHLGLLFWWIQLPWFTASTSQGFSHCRFENGKCTNISIASWDLTSRIFTFLYTVAKEPCLIISIFNCTKKTYFHRQITNFCNQFWLADDSPIT